MRSGLGAQVGISAAEEEYGTYKAPTTFLLTESESLSMSFNELKTFPLRAGRMVQAENLHRFTTKTVEGDLNIPFTDQGMGKFLNLLHGNEVEPEKVEEKSEEQYKQSHAIGTTSPFGKSVTLQVGRPDTENEVRAFSYVGCKLMSASFAVEADGEMMLTASFDGRDLSVEEELAEAEYDAGTLPFTWQQMEVKVGGSKVANVLSGTLKVDIPQKTDRFFLGNGQLKSEPIPNAPAVITFDATLEFADLSDFERYNSEQVKSLALNATGAEIGEAEETFEANFSMPAAKPTSPSAPTVDGPDVLTTDVTFEVLDNGSEAPLTVEYNSTDSAL